MFKKISICLLGIFAFASCDSFLDKEFDASMGEDKVFTNDRLTRQFLTNIYNSLPDGFNGYTDSQFFGAPRDVMTDNAQTAWDIHRYNEINSGSTTNQNNPYAWWWKYYYEAIRKCNKFLENCDGAGITNAVVAGDENMLLTRYKAEARLLRAMFHFELTTYFGDVCIVEKVLTTDDLNRTRNKASDVMKWVADECFAVQDILPFNWASDGSWGRANGAVAMALRSRALLYRASPLFNTDNNKDWWRDAANAADAFIKRNAAFTGQKFELDAQYDKMFYDLPYQSKEVILARSLWYTGMMETQCVPMGFTGCNGYGQVTQNFVDCFENGDGTKFDPTSLKGKNTPYKDRDPRLDMIVFHNESTWGINKEVLQVYSGGKNFDNNVTLTGYYIRKWCHPEVDYNAENRNRGRGWIIYRYAEILLNYAEAINESDGPSLAYDAVNRVRARVGVDMPELSGLTQDEMRDKIHNERRIELSFEDHRYLDVRRWKLYYNADKHREMTNLKAVTVTKTGDQTFTYAYAAYTKGVRVFTLNKHDFFPIPYDQTVKAPNLGQNPGWSK